jgi:hypothetical protein
MEGLELILNRLISEQVQFVIVGGFAAVAHGSTIVTKDLDICIPFSLENVARLEGALGPLHPVHRLTPQRLPFVFDEKLVPDLRNLYLATDAGQLDCLGEVKGVGDFAVASARSVQLQLPFGECRLLDIDALIAAKEAIGRRHDWQTIAQLKAIKERTNPGKS